MREHEWDLRELYQTTEVPGRNPLTEAHEDLDNAVREAYGMTRTCDTLLFLLSLNTELADRETREEDVVGPGLPPCVKTQKGLVSRDCVRWLGKRH